MLSIFKDPVRYLKRKILRHVGLTIEVVTPTDRGTIDSHRARLVGPCANAQKPALRRDRLPTINERLATFTVGPSAPAYNRAVRLDATRVPDTDRDLDELALWRCRLAIAIVPPARHGCIRRQSTTVQTAHRNGEVLTGRRRWWDNRVALSPAYDLPTCRDTAREPTAAGYLEENMIRGLRFTKVILAPALCYARDIDATTEIITRGNLNENIVRRLAQSRGLIAGSRGPQEDGHAVVAEAKKDSGT